LALTSNAFDHHTLITMKRLSSLFFFLLVCGAAQASSVAQSVKPDLAAGEAKATQVCAACHAVDGSRGAAPTPILQGQHPAYLVKQLAEFKSGKRKNAVMSGMATMLTDADMRNVAAFYASKQAKPGAAKSEELKKLGEKIYRGGLMAKSVAACAACHSPNGAGIPAQYPRLAGQHRDYTKAQLVAFRQGERTNSTQMAAIAANLSDKEIDALADYIAGLR
jgi:cytochrome c553